MTQEIVSPVNQGNGKRIKNIQALYATEVFDTINSPYASNFTSNTKLHSALLFDDNKSGDETGRKKRQKIFRIQHYV